MSEDIGFQRSGFPIGLEVLAVDHNRVCLSILEQMLLSCKYKVTVCRRGEEALALLRKDKSRFELVLSDLGVPDMDGFKLVETIGLKMELPVVMMSSNEACDVMVKAINSGACDHLVKPITIDNIRRVWRFVIGKGKNKWSGRERLKSPEEGDSKLTQLANTENRQPETEAESRGLKRERDSAADVAVDFPAAKKPRLIWTAELHEIFVRSVNRIGGHQKAVPKKILEDMQRGGVTDLTRENVASHLQKYRMYMDKYKDSPAGKRGQSVPLIGSKGSNFKEGNPSQMYNLKLCNEYGSLPGMTHFSFNGRTTEPGAAGHEQPSANPKIPVPPLNQNFVYDPRMLGPMYEHEDEKQSNTNVATVSLGNEVLNSIHAKHLFQAQACGNLRGEVSREAHFSQPSSSVVSKAPVLENSSTLQSSKQVVRGFAGPYSNILSVTDFQSQVINEIMAPMASHGLYFPPSDYPFVIQSAPEDYDYVLDENFFAPPTPMVEDFGYRSLGGDAMNSSSLPVIDVSRMRADGTLDSSSEALAYDGPFEVDDFIAKSIMEESAEFGSTPVRKGNNRGDPLKKEHHRI